MTQPERQAMPHQRDRYLNIVYFVDSARTRSIRITLAQARWLLAGATGVSLWALLSVGWILSLDQILTKTRAHLATALSNIFDYQVKYDHIFDAAYPDDATQGYYAEGSLLPANNPTTEAAPQQATKPTNTMPEVSQPQAQLVQSSRDQAITGATTTQVPSAALPTQSPATNGTAPTLTMTHFKLTSQANKFLLIFDINNFNQRKKAEGYIWAVITLTNPDGTQQFLGAPDHAKFDKDGKITQTTSAYRFSIQRFKKKDFEFRAPHASSSKVLSAKVYFSDVSGNDQHSVDVPVESDPQAMKSIPSNEGVPSTQEDVAPTEGTKEP